MTARCRLLSALARLHEEAERAREEAAAEGDTWAAWLATVLLQTLADLAVRAEQERMR